MSQFDWHTEDDAYWREPPPPPKRPDQEPRRRPWPIIFFIVLALLVAGGVVYRQVKLQVESATSTVQADVLSTHNLVQTAVNRRDLELFRSQLSGRDPDWTSAEEAVMGSGLMAGRDFWGWRLPDPLPDQNLTPNDLATAFATLKLSPDLNEAELQYPQSYVLTPSPGITEVITLTQTAVYRRGSQRWLLSPPDEAFWGGWVTNEGDTLKLIYPERDAVVAERLAADLEALLHEICTAWENLPCPTDLHVTLRLSDSPESLLTAPGGAFPEAGQSLTVPTPTLLGLPRDEAGYQAVYRAYGGQLATAVIANLVGWECCQHAPFFQVLTDYLLSQLDLRPWPITSADHIQVLRHSVSMADLNLYWDRRDWLLREVDDGWEVYTAVDFLLQTYPFIDPVQWLRELDRQRSLLNWMNQAFAEQAYGFAAGPGLLEALDEEWWRFAYSQTLLAQEQAPLPAPFPDEDLEIVCMSDTNFDEDSASVLYRFNLESETWTEVLSRTAYLMATPLPDDSGLVLQSFEFTEDNNWQTEFWRDGQSHVLFTSERLSLTLGQFDPAGQYLIVYTESPDSEVPQTSLLDLNACVPDACDPLLLEGQPFWSPDGRSTIIAASDLFGSSTFLINGSVVLADPSQPSLTSPLHLGDGQGQLLTPDGEPAGEGYSPFWIDNQRFGYVRPGAEEVGDEVVLANAADPTEAAVVLTLADITAVGPSGISAPASIRYVITHPAHPTLLFVVSLDALSREAYVFTYDLEAKQLDLRLQSPVWPYHALGFSPDGRWLILTGSDPQDASARASGASSSLFVHNIASHQTQTYVSQFASGILSPLFDWSVDSQWLLFVVDDRILSLVAPDYDYQWVFAHNQGNCMATSWTK